MTVELNQNLNIGMRPLAGGGFESAIEVAPPSSIGDPLVRFDFANGDTMSSPSVNNSGFFFTSTTRAIEQAPNGQLGMKFFYGGTATGNGGPDQYYDMGTQLFETFERIVLWIPSNFEHRSLMRCFIDAGSDISTWQVGDIVEAPDSQSARATVQLVDGQTLWLKNPERRDNSLVWANGNTLTNIIRSLTAVSNSFTTSPGSNNKFSAQWEGTYSSGNASIVEYDRFYSAEDSEFTCSNISAGPGGSSTTANRTSSTPVPPGIDRSEDSGTLKDFVIRRRRASSLANNDGLTQIWKDGTLVYERTDLPLFSETANYFDSGYILGYANSGFDEDTTFYVTKYELYDSTRPEGVPSP